MKKILIGLSVILLLVVVAWAPWMDNDSVQNFVVNAYGTKDGTVQYGKVVCEYSVRWVPFGRLAVSCEGGHFVPFWIKV